MTQVYNLTIPGGRLPSDVTSERMLLPVLVEADAALADAMEQEDGSDIYFTDSGGTALDFVRVQADRVLLADAAATWYATPEAIQTGGYIYCGGCSGDGMVKVAKIDATTREVVQTAVVDDIDEGDDHNNPTWVELDDGNLRIFYSQHTGRCWTAVTTTPGDLSTLAATATEITSSLNGGTATITYPKPVIAGGLLWVFYRTGNFENGLQRYVTSSDDGETWSSPVTLISHSGFAPYVLVRPNGANRIDIGFSDRHPVDTGTCVLYHGYINTTDSKLYETNGTEIGLLSAAPYVPTDFTVAASGAEYWISDLRIDGSGNPIMASTVATITTTGVGTSTNYYWHRSNAGTWDAADLITAGGPVVAGLNNVQEYPHGLEIDPNDTNTVVAVIGDDYTDPYVSATSTGFYQRLVKFTTADTGATWTPTELVPRARRRMLRPVIPDGGSSALVLYQIGWYAYYNDNDFRMSVTCYPPPPRGTGVVDGMWVVGIDNFDASSGLTIQMHATGASDLSSDANVVGSDGLFGVFGETAWRSVNSDGALASEVEATVAMLGRWTVLQLPREQTFLSSWSTSASEGQILFRKDNTTDALEAFARLSDTSQIGGTFSDLAVSRDQWLGMAWRFNATELSVALNGSISATTFSNGSGLALNANTTSPLVIGTTAHIDTDMLSGTVPIVLIADASRSDAWIQSQTTAFSLTDSLFNFSRVPVSLTSLYDSIVAYWPLDETSGTRAAAIGSDDLTDNNTVLSATGKFSNAADFETSASEFLSATSSATLQMGNIDCWMRCWVKLESKAADMDIISKYETVGDNREYRLWYTQSTDRFTFSVSTTGTTGNTVNVTANNHGAVSTGVWYMLYAWHDSVNNVMGISINAGEADTAAIVSGINASNSRFCIGALGRATAGAYFDGLIDDVVLGKGYVPTSLERAADYNGGDGLAASSFITASTFYGSVFADWPTLYPAIYG